MKSCDENLTKIAGTIIWWQQIRKRKSPTEEWSYLKDFQRLLQLGEWKWVGHGKQAVALAKDKYAQWSSKGGTP